MTSSHAHTQPCATPPGPQRITATAARPANTPARQPKTLCIAAPRCFPGLQRVIDEMCRHSRWRPYFAAQSHSAAAPQSFTNMLREAGLSVLSIRERVEETRVSRAGLEDHLRQAHARDIAAVATAEQDRFVNEALDRYLGVHPLNEWELCRLDMLRLVATAKPITATEGCQSRQRLLHYTSCSLLLSAPGN